MYQLEPGTRVLLSLGSVLSLLSLPLVRLWNLNGKERQVRTKCNTRPVKKKIIHDNMSLFLSSLKGGYAQCYI